MAEGIAATTRPPIISHTGCRTLHDNPRNVWDAEMKACADKGGVIGIYWMPFLVANSRPGSADLVRHMDHVKNLCGEDHVSIGTDGVLSKTVIDDKSRAAQKKFYEDRAAQGIAAPGEGADIFNIVAVFRTSTHGEKGDVASYRKELEQTYGGAHPAMRALIAMMDLGRRWQVGDRAPVRHWHRGRVVLLGDAAHAPLQSLAQGACMAIEDGLCLGELICAANGDLPAAFHRFEALRLARTARVQLESRTIWDWLLHAEGIARDVRNATVADWDEPHMFDCLSWLYDGAPMSTKLNQ